MNHRGSASRLRTRLVSCRSGCSHTNGTGSVGMRPGAASTVLSRVSSLSVYPILPAPRCWWFYKIPTTLKKYIVASPQLIDASSLLSSAHPPRTWTPGGSVRALDHLPEVHQEHQRRWKMMMHILICTWLPLTVCPTYSGVQHKKEKKKKLSSWWSTSYISEFMIIKRSCKTITKHSASFLSLQVWLHLCSLVREEKFKFWVEPTDGGIHTIQ